jgi:hypothetical protein
MSMVMVHHYTLTTGAPKELVAELLGKAWTANRLRSRSKIEDIGPHQYRFDLLGVVFDAAITASNGSSVLSTHVHYTPVQQDKLLLIIPFGRKEILANDLQADLIKKKLSRYLQEAGHDVSIEITSVAM